MVNLAKIVDLVTHLQAALAAWVEIADEEDRRDSDDDALKQASEFITEVSGGHRYWAVTGRKHGDNEDTMHIFCCAEREVAVAGFKEAMLEGKGLTVEHLQGELTHNRQEPDCQMVVYINSVCVSDTLIEEC